VAITVEVEQAKISQKPFWTAAVVAKVFSGHTLPRVVTEIGDKVTILYESIPPPIPGVLLRSMGRCPKGDMCHITRKIAAATAAGQFHFNFRKAKSGDITIPPPIDLQAGQKHPSHAAGSGKVEKLLNSERGTGPAVHHPVIGSR
jgi:hypothetical protein